MEDAQLVYDITVRQNGRERDLTIATSGTLLSKQLFPNEVSAAIQNTIQAHLGDGKLQRIDRTLEEGETFFEVEFRKNGRDRSISISPEGKLVGAQVFLDELPPPAQKSIQSQTATGKLDRIDRTVEDGEVFYEIEWTQAGRDREFSVDGTGKIRSVRVAPAETPEPVRKAINGVLSKAALVRIDKIFDSDGTSYEVALLRQGKKVVLSIDEDGTVDEADK